jgi:hypothetical protein
VNSPAGKTAQAFDGTKQSISNFTALSTSSSGSVVGTFTPTSPNMFSQKTNQINWK